MKILGIETSCDESAVSVVAAGGDLKQPKFKVLAHLVSSQVALHAKWGGVVPSLAKREHAKNLLPLLQEVLVTAGLNSSHRRRTRDQLTIDEADQVRRLLEREPELLEQFLLVIPKIKRPEIDLIAVTQGPGLEPALWVGINLAKALSLVWQIPVAPINHLEGHLVSVLAAVNKPARSQKVNFPILALLVSGGHTELVLARDWLKYELLGQTRDDAVGEAFDKVARILGLPYPGGPEIARLADLASGRPPEKLPRPMMDSPNYDFSFSGLKTAALYLVKRLAPINQLTRVEIAREFQQAVIDVLISKTARAIKEFEPKTLIIAGGVAANRVLREQFASVLEKHFPKVALLTPDLALTGDNATMIALAGFFRASEKSLLTTFAAHGTLPLA